MDTTKMDACDDERAFACNEVDRVPSSANWGPEWLHADPVPPPTAGIELDADGLPPTEDIWQTIDPPESKTIYPFARELETLRRAPTKRLTIGDVDPAAIPNPLCRCDRCGSPDVHDWPIHDGRSVRRDCGRCHSFLGWPKWYGETIQKEILAKAHSIA